MRDMADITTHYQDGTLLVRISDAIQASAAGALFVNLVEILSEAERSADVRSLVLAGQQGFLPSVTQPAGASVAELQAWLEGWHTLLETVDTGAKPVIAVLEGEVSACGLALALACERVVGSRSLRLLHQEGMPPLGVGLACLLARRVPPAMANRLLLGAPERIRPEQLLYSGLVGSLVEPGEALDQALAEASYLNQHDPQTLEQVRALLRQAPEQSLHAALETERQLAWKLQSQARVH